MLIKSSNAITLGAILLNVTQANSASFQGIGLPNVNAPSYTAATVMSGDGSTVGGDWGDGSNIRGDAFIWSSGTGTRVLARNEESHVTGLSYDGKLAVGFSNVRGQTFLSNQAGPAQYVSNPANVTDGYAVSLSSDGKTALGNFRDQPQFGGGTGTYFLSTHTESWTKIDALPFFGSATGLSPDGNVVLGSVYSLNEFGFGAMRGVRWTQATGVQQLPTPSVDENGMVIDGSGFSVNVTLTDASTHGDVIVGSVDAGLSFHRAFRWTADGGMALISPIPGIAGNFASAVTPDGRFIVGGEGYAKFGADGNGAFVWDATTGQSKRVSDVLWGLGVDIQGWKLSGASAISDDGSFIAGTGINPQGRTEAWIANLAPVPESSQWILMLAGLGIMGAYRARISRQ